MLKLTCLREKFRGVPVGHPMQQKVELGYCESCAENTAHAQVAAQLATQPHHWVSTRLGGGPWYCRTCRRQQWRLTKPLRGSADGTPSIDSVAEAEASAEASVSVGNFIRGEGNLVMQSHRANRFTEKFRVSVVQRVLEGKQSLAQIAAELEIPQADIIVWLGQQFAEKQEKIDQLSRTIERLMPGAGESVGLSRVQAEPIVGARIDEGDDLGKRGGAGVVDGIVKRD